MRRYFDSPKISLSKLKHVLRAKAVLCPGLTVKLLDEVSGERAEWFYEDGLRDYLTSMLVGYHPVGTSPRSSPRGRP